MNIDSTLTRSIPIHTRQANKAGTRRTILKAAEALFSTHGFEETRAEQIAREAGVAVGTIYLHFGDKEGLLRQILLEAADELNQRVAQVYQNPPADPQVLARAHVETIVQYVEEHESISGFVLGLMLSRRPAARPMLERAVEQVEQSIRQGQEQGIYRQDIDPHLAARAETQMNLGLLAWWAEDPHRASREEIINTLAKFRFSGLHVQMKSP
jgi:AcrR family transcriptional regulator